MKYTFVYKTPDGVRHEGSINAKSRDAAFAELRTRGIRPIKVVASDGSRANGEMRGVRKRAVAAIAAIAAAAAGLAVYFGNGRSGIAAADGEASSAPRHQIYGDPAIVSAFERGDFGDTMKREGDRLLARFAQPGKFMSAGGADPRALTSEEERSLKAYAESELAAERDIPVSATDRREERELKQIVNWMREEMREYLANGNGTVRSYWRRLNERMADEMRIYNLTKRELEKEASEEIWEEKNEKLRRLGLLTIPEAPRANPFFRAGP